MNARSPEEQLQKITPPTADPAARLAARRAAVAEFERLHAANEPAPAKRWQLPRIWMGGFATACVAFIGVSIYWLMPPEERVVSVAPPIQADVMLEVKSEVPPPPPEVQIVDVPPVSVPPVLVGIEVPEPPNGAIRVVTERPPAPTPAPPAPRAPAATAPAQAGGRSDSDEVLHEVPVTGSRIQAQNGQTQAVGTPPARNEASLNDATANLRGIDPSLGGRSLTLVDGRRAVSTSNQSDIVDLNTIPSNLLQRTEVVTGGASASYGSAASASYGIRVREANDRFEQFADNPVKLAAEEPESTFSVDVDTASYSFTRRMLNGGTLPPADAVRAEEMINYFDYGWPAADSRREPFRPTVTVSDSPWGEGRKLVHIGIKGYELPARDKPDVNLVLLLDVSGSMNSPDKLPLARRSVSLLLDSLKPTDTVAIAVYAGAAGQVLAPTPVRERERIEEALNALRPGGSTAGAQGIRLAYELARRSFREGGVNRILLATDGDFNVGTSSTDELQRLVEREREGGIFLSVLGFGQGNYRDDVAQTLAQNGNGVAAYIDNIDEARKVLVQQAGSTLFTIASDVKIQVEFNPATVAEYRLIGYETRALNREDFNNDRVDAGEVGSGHTVTAIYEITPVGAGTRMIDQRRYAAEPAPAEPPARGRSRSNEYGYLKIRYKLPGEESSRLLEQPIRTNAGMPARLRPEVAFATAVAGFAQLLRGGQYTGDFSFDDVIRMADGARGEDEFGYRSEFVELARKARDLSNGDMRNGLF